MVQSSRGARQSPGLGAGEEHRAVGGSLTLPFFNYSLQVQYSVFSIVYVPGYRMFKRKYLSEPKRLKTRTQKKTRTEKGTHDTEKDAEKDTEQPKSSRGKQTSAYPGHSAGLQGNLNYGARGVA